jgi:glycosyltransferase A (GT-A) superfamily protein (DUF2064 family)
MQRIMECLPPGPAVIVGTDIPQLDVRHIAEAFRVLCNHDAVFGPALDGGYWLVGLRRRPRILSPFTGVRWSSSYALADTLANLEGCRVFCLAGLGDIDDARDLATHGARFGRRVSGAPSACRRSREPCAVLPPGTSETGTSEV